MIERVAGLIYTEEIYLITKTTVVLNQPWDNVAAADKTLLEKILSAVKLTLNDVDILHQSVLDLGALPTRPRRLIYFGGAVTGLSSLEVIDAAGSSVIIAPSLNELQSDDAAKKKLWGALKVLFKL